MNPSTAAKPTTESLHEDYRSAMKAGDHQAAMASLSELLTSKDIKRFPSFSHQYFVRPVLDDGLMDIKACADVVKGLELHALKHMAQNYGTGIAYSQKEAKALGVLGLRTIGQFMFIHSPEAGSSDEDLVEAEQLFKKGFSLGQLVTLHAKQAVPRPIAAFCNVYLARNDACLPLNCPTTVKVDRDLLYFGDKLTSLSSFDGVAEVLVRHQDAPQERKVAMAVDLIQSVDENSSPTLLRELKRQLGTSLVAEAEAAIGQVTLGSAVKTGQNRLIIDGPSL